MIISTCQSCRFGEGNQLSGALSSIKHIRGSPDILPPCHDCACCLTAETGLVFVLADMWIMACAGGGRRAGCTAVSVAACARASGSTVCVLGGWALRALVSGCKVQDQHAENCGQCIVDHHCLLGDMLSLLACLLLVDKIQGALLEPSRGFWEAGCAHQARRFQPSMSPIHAILCSMRSHTSVAISEIICWQHGRASSLFEIDVCEVSQRAAE